MNKKLLSALTKLIFLFDGIIPSGHGMDLNIQDGERQAHPSSTGESENSPNLMETSHNSDSVQHHQVVKKKRRNNATCTVNNLNSNLVPPKYTNLMTPQCDILPLPGDIWKTIFLRLSLKDCMKVRVVCNEFKIWVIREDRVYPENRLFNNSSVFIYPNLESLNLNHTSIVKNDTLGHLKSLSSLSLGSSNKLTNMALKDLTNLTNLSLGHSNKMSNDAIKGLRNLTTLSLGHNKKMSNVGIKDLTNLTHLSLGGQERITNFGLKCLTNLSTLHLGVQNKITDMCFSSLTNLTFLDLTMNKTITDEIGHFLPNLKIVEGRNFIKS